MSYQCCICGAGYYGQAAAEGCCAAKTVASLMDNRL